MEAKKIAGGSPIMGLGDPQLGGVLGVLPGHALWRRGVAVEGEPGTVADSGGADCGNLRVFTILFAYTHRVPPIAQWVRCAARTRVRTTLPKMISNYLQTICK